MEEKKDFNAGLEEKEGSELDKLYEASFKTLEEGSIVKGRIIHIRNNDVLLDLGYKAEGIVSRDEFLDPEEVRIGNEVDVYVVSMENDEGLVVLSKRRADKILGWEKITTEYKEGDVVTGKVVKRVKGGLMVNIGVEAFLPASLADIKVGIDLDSLVGKTIKAVIVSINTRRKNVVISRKDYLIQEMERKKTQVLERLKPGDVVEGIVKNITDYGAFVEIDQLLDGLLHISDMSWGRLSHPSEILAVGDRVKVKVLEVDKEEQKVSLGLKQLTPDPWEDIDKKYPPGTKVKGKVTNILSYGAFIELEPGVEGFVHISDFSWTRKIRDAHEVLAIGDVVEAVVLSIDKERRRISLGLKQLEKDPWQDIESRYPLDSKVTGKVVGFNEDGAFVEVDDGIDGFIYKNDISWTRRINHAYEVLHRGQKLEFKVIGINKAFRQLILGLKQLRPDPWPQIEEKYKPGTIVEGKVTSVFPFGIFVQLEEDLEGLLHISEIERKPGKLQERFAPGDTIKVMILSLDKEKKQIRLTRKGISETEASPSKDTISKMESRDEDKVSEEDKQIQTSEENSQSLQSESLQTEEETDSENQT
ncbi:MAG TPA: 30S ribosomal protein S1 [Candidatus Omnitrophica bacterium]|nr:30S ribosomal protein S1 [Candidatus Omnitrophota bacterium]